MTEVTCPFCKQQGFDLIGLKDHFYRYCDEYQNTISTEEERRRRKINEESGSEAC